MPIRKSPGDRGDLFVEVSVELPLKISPKTSEADFDKLFYMLFPGEAYKNKINEDLWTSLIYSFFHYIFVC